MTTMLELVVIPDNDSQTDKFFCDTVEVDDAPANAVRVLIPIDMSREDFGYVLEALAHWPPGNARPKSDELKAAYLKVSLAAHEFATYEPCRGDEWCCGQLHLHLWDEYVAARNAFEDVLRRLAFDYDGRESAKVAATYGDALSDIDMSGLPD